MATDERNYDITSQMEVWKDDDLIRYALDTEFMMGLEKYQIVNIAQELAYRYDEGDSIAYEYNG